MTDRRFFILRWPFLLVAVSVSLAFMYRYGPSRSLGAGIGFMVWLWTSAVIVLLGAQLNAETEHQTSRDTMESRPKPMGSRGAMMADHVGKAQE